MRPLLAGFKRLGGLVAATALLVLPLAFTSTILAQDAAPTPAQYAAESASMPPEPPAENRLEPVRLSDVEGAVRLLDANGKIVDQARANLAVLPGMRVEAGNDGRAELEFADGAVARITPNSSLTLVSINRNNNAGQSHTVLQPTKGLTYYELPLSGGGYAVRIGPLTATRGVQPEESGAPALLRVNLDGTPYEAAVLRGDFHFEDEGRNVAYSLDANQTAKIDPAAANNYDTVQAVTPDTWDAWNADRDAALAELANARPAGDDHGGPGWSDLDYYGSWYNIPGQGMAWAPDGVDENFDPYGSGAWTYYSGIGYSWASSYPWGWLPYHCGSWSFYGSYGWMWSPASCGWGYGGGWFPYSEARGRGGYQLPLRPLPARGFTHVPPSRPVIVVQRGGPVRFRAIGEPRPVTRPVVVAGETVLPAPVEARPAYGVFGGGAGYAGRLRTSQGNMGAVHNGGTLQPGQPGYGVGMRAVLPPSGTPRFTPAPAPTVPVMRMPAPPAPVARPIAPPAAPAAPHIAAPAAVHH